MTDDKQKQAAKLKLDAFLKANSLRRTPERYAVLDKVTDTARPFGVDEITNALVAEGFMLSRTTVYSTLNLLAKCGIIRQHRFGSLRASRFERENNANGSIHLICSQCGKIKEAKDTELMATLNAKTYSAFHPAHTCLYVYGICSTCSRKNRKSKQENKTTHTQHSKKKT
ncbi:MAG: transcriptional repressor [Muribaculum sp.]|nr:transcriptional repressor [Muribaculaceae bacterium]MCM1080520.1 transcriptional repressor [Muribaculum sp.]